MTNLQRLRSILAGLFMIIGGLLMINDPEDGYVVITFIMGVTLLIRGIQNIVYYFTFARHMGGGRTMRAIGIVLLDLGAFTLTLTDVPKIYVILYLLVLHLFTGVIDVMHALETKRQGSQHWRLNLAVGVANILVAIKDTLLYTMVTLVGLVIISALLAYEFTFYQFPGRKLLYALLMGSMMLPLVLYVIPLYRFVFQIGMSDTLAGVALPMMVSPLAVFILMSFLEDLPISFIESARIDGAGHFRIFGSIVLPLMRNGLITVTVIMFLRVWGSYLWPSLITGNNIHPLSVAISNMLSPNFYVDSRVKIASMLISMLPPALIYLFFQRQVIEGMTMSGVKG